MHTIKYNKNFRYAAWMLQAVLSNSEMQQTLLTEHCFDCRHIKNLLPPVYLQVDGTTTRSFSCTCVRQYVYMQIYVVVLVYFRRVHLKSLKLNQILENKMEKRIKYRKCSSNHKLVSVREII